MVTLRCLSRTGKKPSRFSLDIESLSQPVSDLRKSVSTLVKLKPFEVELVYCGRCLKDDQPIERYGLKAGCTLHVLLKRISESPPPLEPVFPDGLNRVNAILKLAEFSGKNRQSIEKVLRNPEVIENVIEATPGLAADHLAVALLKDHVLLQQAAKEEEVIRKLLCDHPALGHAVQHLVAVINEEVAKSKKTTTGTETGEDPGASNVIGSSYSIDSLSEEEDDSQLPGPSWNQLHQNRPITADQLASALAMATGAANAGQLASTSNSHAASSSATASSAQPPSGLDFANALARAGQQSSNLISPTFFQQAMRAALGTADSQEPAQREGALLGGGGGSGSFGGSGAPSSSVVSEAAVEQLRQMGIEDVEVARRALEAAGGDLRAALDLIFGDGMMF